MHKLIPTNFHYLVLAPRDKNTKTLRKNKKHIAIHKNTLKRSRETVNIKKQGFYIFLNIYLKLIGRFLRWIT